MRPVNVLHKGQVIIPADIRHRYDIKPGSALEIREAGDHLEIYVLPADPVAAFRGSLKSAVSLADQLMADHCEEVKQDATG